jgi:tetratricopeptide (TPR) repeat protein
MTANATEYAAAQHEKGLAAMAHADTSRGLAHIKAAIEADPTQDSYWLSYADGLAACGELATALAVMDAAHAAGLSSPALTHLSAQLKARSEAEQFHATALRDHQQHRLTDAVASYAKALSLWPDFPEAEVNLGSALQAQGAYAEAIVHFSRAVALKPFFAEAHYNLANAQASSGQDPEAAYRAAIAIRPDYALAHFNLGVALENAGRAREAEQTYRDAAAADPGFAEAWSNLGVLLFQEKRYKDALAAYDAALVARPDFAAAHNNRGNALRAMGAPDEAAAAYQGAIRRAPGFVEAHNHLGNVYRAQGKLQEAAACYRQAMSLDPNFAEASYNLGYVLMESGAIAEGFSQLTLHAHLACGTGQKADLPRHKHAHDAEQRAYLGPGGADPSGPLWLDNGDKVAAPAVKPHPELQARWRGDNPLVVIDDFLSADALAGLRRFCWRSTIWREVYAGGYVGAFPEHGLTCPLLAQIAQELKEAYPGIFGGHPLLQIWAFKYDSRLRGIPIHADFAAVNVNFWITPDEANLDKDHGGLVIWDKPAPLDWDFEKYNIDAGAARDFLKREGAKSTTVPYRANRAVIFDSDLFHETDDLTFAEGYCNRRINLTLLYGRRNG